MAHQRSLSALTNPLLFATSALLLLSALSAPVYAQSVTFAGVQATVPASGLLFPFAMAVDGAGDVFIADSGNSRVVEVPAGGGPQTTVSASGLYYPSGVAVDRAGDVFIADPYNSRVVEVPAGGGPQTTVGSGLSWPYGVAVDGAGDVFIADSYNSRVVEVPAGGGPQTTVGSGLGVSYGVAVDGAGNVFIADNANNQVVEVPAGGGPQTTVGSGLSGPYGVAVDGAGNVFIADEGNFRVVEVPAGGGPQTTVSVSGMYFPTGVAVDGAGDLFVADQNNSRVAEVQRVAVNFGNVNVCPAGQITPAPCNQTLTLNYSIAETTTFGPTNVVTQGAPNLDFTLSSSTCTGTLLAGSTCTVNVTFAPLAPGARMGAVQLTCASNQQGALQARQLPEMTAPPQCGDLTNVLVTTMIHGAGQGPAIAFGPGVQTTLNVTVGGNGLNYPTGVAMDAAGDVFIADRNNSRVVEVPAGGGAQTAVGSGLSYPADVAVDGAGDVFIADSGNNRVVEVPAGGGPQTTVGSGLNSPYGVALDGAGDVFIADTYNSRVVEVPAGGGPQTMLGNGLSYPFGVAVDGAGDVFIADSGNNRVVEVPSGGAAQTTVPASGLNSPSGLAVDGAGDVFIADTNNSRVVEVPAGGGPQTTVGNGLNYPYEVEIDAAGDVFIADALNNRVLQVQRSQPPTMNFASTLVGSTSSDSPQSVTIQNIGNQPLNAISPGLLVAGPNFLQVAGSGTPADCTGGFSLTPGATCNLSISFEPQSAGNVTAAATFTDNALNASPSASQSIALQGIGQGTQTISFTTNAPASAIYNTSFTVGATGGASGNPVTFTSSGACSNVGATYTMTSGTGTCAVIANQAGTAYYLLANTVTQTVAAIPATTASQTITFTQSAPVQALFNSGFSVAATGGASGNPITFTSSGACSNVGATYTMTSGTGTCSVIADQAGNNNYSAAPTVTQTVTATPVSQTIAFTQSAPSPARYNSSFTVAATASSGQPVSFSSSGVCSNVGVTFTMTSSTGTCKVIANQSGNANYLAAPPVTETTTASKAAQTAALTGAPAAAPYLSTFTVAATTNSGITPTITAAGSCSITGTTVTMTSGTGTCTMTAKWAANPYYLAATVTKTTTAQRLVSTITWPAPAAITYGTALSGTQLNATANVAGTFAYSPAAGTMPKKGTNTLKVTFTPTLSMDYTTATASVAIQVGQATPTITWPTPAAIAYGTPLSGTQLNATANAAGKFAYSPAAKKVLTAGTYTLSLTFTPTDLTDYISVTDTVTLVVNTVGTTTTITSNIPNPSVDGRVVTVHFTVTSATNYTAPTGTVTVNASSGESCMAMFSGGSGSCTLKFNTAGPRTLTATYSGDSNNNPSISAAVTQTVN